MYAREWSLAQSNTYLRPKHNDIPQSPPILRDGTINCCTDAAWNSETRMAGLGWNFTDSKLTTNHSTVVPHVVSPLMGELLALRDALLSATQIGFRSITFHSDSSILIKAIKSKSQLLEILGILFDIQACLPNFNFICFKCIPREANTVADSIAKQALSGFIVTEF
ncbi:unnamed protein product [Arabis nemorensis]|uniref:RNase H type-1 domain-containing protein n=1 Tax=Arabis nemorensis TaxID=586526 RepID=A0A565AYW8_9BRAS|nr:unnamed protein product [Arabis nemorensis]